MGNYGIRIAKDGYDALSGLDDGMVFTSKSFLFKTNATGTALINVPFTGTVGYTSTTLVAHGLGYRPVIMCYWSVDNVNWRPTGYKYPGGAYLRTTGTAFEGNNFTIEAGANTTNVVIQLYSLNGSAATIYIRYVVYVDSLD